MLLADPRRGQVSLSLKALQEDPLVPFANRIGEVLTGPVTRTLPFGVFVELAPDVLGMLPASELTGTRSGPAGPPVQEGDLLTVRVAEVDLQRHRVRLSAVDRDGGGPPR